MVKWSNDKQYRDFCAREGGYNVTGTLVHFDMTKPPSGPGLPYKMRRRMDREPKKRNSLNHERRDLVRYARISRLLWTAVLYASVLAMWVAVWWYAGVQYGK